ncbi:MAG TPA: DUF4118 domain-containing protein [Microthrixaceae bacterium]|jgi:hypothetical protein|nr:DUF4118 domain-containing protein [Microthrixaceae bacterium]
MDIQQYSFRREAETGTGTDWFVGLGGFGVSLLIAGVLEGPRATIGSTNVALFLAVVVVAAGVLGRRAGGWITALGAALSFNFFHTRPVHTLRIASGRDVITVVLLAALGGLAGELAHRRQTAVRNAEGGRESTRVLHLNAEECRTATSANAAVLSSTAAITQLLGAESVAFEHGAAGGPGSRRIEHNGTLTGVPLRATPSGYDLGEIPVTIDVTARDRILGRFLVVPTDGHPVSLDARLGAIVVADQLSLALVGTLA